jgi:hypothetical protein
MFRVTRNSIGVTAVTSTVMIIVGTMGTTTTAAITTRAVITEALR